jgi:hypothetical protein
MTMPNMRLFGMTSSAIVPTGPAGIFKILLTTTDTDVTNLDIKTGLLTAAALYPGLTLSITEVYDVTSIPTVTVGQYDAIFFWSNGAVPWNASLNTHNSNNGGLVTAQFYSSTGITSITPAGLMPTVNKSGGQAGGSIVWPSPPYSHPIANGSNSSTQRVTSFASASFAASNPTLNIGASTVVSSTTSVPFVVVKDNSAPTGRTVFLNLFPRPPIGWNSTTYPQGFLLMLNALLWSGRKI